MKNCMITVTKVIQNIRWALLKYILHIASKKKDTGGKNRKLIYKISRYTPGAFELKSSFAQTPKSTQYYIFHNSKANKRKRSLGLGFLIHVIYMLDLQPLLLDYLFYPDKNSKECKQYRQDTTIKYGCLMGWFTLGCLVFIAFQNSLIKLGYWYPSKFHILKPINQFCDRLSNTRSTIRPFFLLISTLTKKLAYLIYLNCGTLFQIALWCGVSTILGFTDINGGDLIFLAKRLGRLCVVSLPTVFFLTLRPSPLPNTLYLGLLPIHKWLSRVVVLLAVIHTIIYLGYFHRNGTWAKALKRDNLYGWAALMGFMMIIITSVLKVRDYSYKTFFLNHYVWSWVIVLTIPYHVRPVRSTYANTLNILILLYQVYNRLASTVTASSAQDFSITDVSSNFALIKFPNYLIKNRANNPGAHVRLTNYHPNFIVRFFKSLIPNYHPYTLASLPGDRYQTLIVRKSSFEWVNNKRYIMFGSFDPNLLLVKSRNTAKERFSISKLSINAKKILIVVGGSAISFAIPILRVAAYHGVPAKILWVIRDFRDIAILKYFDGYINGDDFEIFVTGSPSLGDSEVPIKSAPSYGTFGNISKKSSAPTFDVDEHSRLTQYNDESESDLNQELENVDIDLSDEEEPNDMDDCYRECNALAANTSDFNTQGLEDGFEGLDEEYVIGSPDLMSLASKKSSKSQSTNEQFTPELEANHVAFKEYRKTIRRLNLENRVYMGRPKLNYRYFNWCVNQLDVFTQCSGPVLDDSSNLVCCKDLPGRNKINHQERLPDADKVWVISAGPKTLVKNVKLWASENGLKYHEEAFYV